MLDLSKVAEQAEGMKLSPAILDMMALQMRNALEMVEDVPDYVVKAGEDFRAAVKRWSGDLKAKAAKAQESEKKSA